MRFPSILAALLLCAGVHAAPAQSVPSAQARATAAYAVKTYPEALIESLGKMVRYQTVADKQIAYASNPAHLGFKKLIEEEATRLGLDFSDLGYVIVVGLGQSSERVGIITHGDVQPVDASKWKKSPFELDRTSEPGRLVARGTVDDKGPIATAMYAMKSIKDRNLALSKRLELYIYMAEESDWAPLEELLKTHVPPQINITIDADYPVVTAEKGWGSVSLTIPRQAVPAQSAGATLSAFGGGFFGSQIPEDAEVVIAGATPALEQALRRRAARQAGMRYTFSWSGAELRIKARGRSAHSSKPEGGVNAISMLADALRVQPWANTTAGAMVNFLNDMVGTGYHGKQFGAIAYRDAFMGPMTFAPTVIKQLDTGIELSINLRRPQGKTGAQLEAEMRAALAQWQARQVALADIKITLTEPWVQNNAPHVPTLLSVFSHYTGVKNPKPIAIGGGTNSRMFPNAVSFGPAMPGAEYSAHTEHEFITLKQLLLNLQMYTAVMVELAK